MEYWNNRIRTQLNNLPGFPPRHGASPSTPTTWQLGEWIGECHVRPAVANAAALPLVDNEIGDVRASIADQVWYIWDGAAWQTMGGGGGGVPSAPLDSVQFNNAGAFGGSANLTWDNGTGTLKVDGSVDRVTAGTLTIGGTTATAITIGSAGITTNFPGPVALTGDVITVGGTTFTTDATFEGNVTFGAGAADTVTFAALTTVTSNINFGGAPGTYKITNLANGTNPNDAVNYSQLSALVTGVSAVTASGPLSSSGGATPDISFPSWPANAAGALTNNGSGTLSWVPATGGTITGSGTATQLAYFTGASAIGSENATGTNALTWDSGANELGVRTNNPLAALDVASGQVAVPSASAAAPALTFRDDLTTGIYRPSVPTTIGTGIQSVEAVGFALDGQQRVGIDLLNSAAPLPLGLTATVLAVGQNATSFGTLQLGNLGSLETSDSLFEGHLDTAVLGQGPEGTMTAYDTSSLVPVPYSNAPSGWTTQHARGSQTNVRIAKSTPTSSGSPTQAQRLALVSKTGDLLGTFGSSGFDGASFVTSGNSGNSNTFNPSMAVVAAQDFSYVTSSHGALIDFSTTALNTANATKRVRIGAGGNVGIGGSYSGNVTEPPALLSVGTGAQFQVNSSGNITSINNVTTSFPALQGAAGTVLTNNGSGTLSWATPSTAAGTVDITATAQEALNAGDLVVFNNNGGTPNVRKADATNTDARLNPVGFTTASAAGGASVTVRIAGVVDVPAARFDAAPATTDVGKRVFVSTTAGQITLTAPSASGDVVQRAGVLVDGSANPKVLVQIGDPILL